MKFRIDLKIIFFIALFLITKQFNLYITIMLFALLHEIAHMFIAILLKYKIKELELMPFGFWASMEPNFNDYSRIIIKSNIIDVKNIFIAIAGPLLNLIFVIIFKNLENNFLAYSNLVVFILNLIPIYPLDGGRILQSTLRIFFGKKEGDSTTNYVANALIIILTIVESIAILYLKNIYMLLILAYLWELVILEKKRFELKKKIWNWKELENQ